MDTGTIKKEILNILDVFDETCKKNNIQYSLGYGTLLGAIRHKGFIPWDDDVDVVLTTENYYKLRVLAEDNPFLGSGQRYLIKIPGDKDYCYSYIKIIDTKYRVKEKSIADRYCIGLFIDVFRIDYWPNTYWKEFLQLKSAKFLNRIKEILIRGNIQPDSKYALLDKLLMPVDHVFRLFRLTPETICKKLEKTGLHNKPDKYVGNIMSASGKKTEKLPKDLFDEFVEVQFENKFYPAMKAYDKYLKCLYNDYMVIPSKDKQIGHEYSIEVLS